MFADISGFTPLTEALTTALGPRAGGEAITDQINAVYAPLIAAVDRYSGSVISFAGDAITCWFDDTAGPGAPRAVACAQAMQAAMGAFAALSQPDGEVLALRIKIAVAAGPAWRFLVGDPAHQVLEALAGPPVDRIAAAEALARPGEILLDQPTAECGVRSAQWRPDPETGERFAVLAPDTSLLVGDDLPAHSALRTLHSAFPPEAARPWLLPTVYARLTSGQGEFLTELRPAVALFLRFANLAYATDPTAPARLDGFIRWVQTLAARYDGTLLQLTLGDKGSYLYLVWGAPVAHEDDTRRATAAAAELRTLPVVFAGLGPVQIGISQGVMRTGACGSATRRTYAVLGDAVNLAARLMMAAAPGQVLASAALAEATARAFAWQPLPPVQLKGKHAPVPVAALQAARAPLWRPEPRAPTPLVGRTPELAQIAARLDRARGGQGQVLGITGEAGIGKSRLLAEAVRGAQDQGWVVYGGAAQSFGTSTPYLAWRPLWQMLFGLDPAADAAAPDQMAQVRQRVRTWDLGLEPRLPLLEPLLGLPFPPTPVTASMDEKLRKESREALLLALLRAQSHTTPLLLVLEDAHWLDPLSHDLLEEVGRASYNLPLALLVAYRPPELARLAAPRVANLPHFTEIALRELPPAEAQALAAARLAPPGPAGPPVPPAAVAAVVTRAAGNPFYLEELCHYLVEQQIDLADPAALGGVAWPESLHRLVLGRIDRLAALPQLVLKVASILGRVFAVRWLWGVYPALGPAAAVAAALGELAQRDLTPQEPGAPEATYLFKHIVTQEVAYSSLGAATRAGLHEQVARWLEAAGPLDLDLLAYHYGHSENRAKQRAYYRQAGVRAAAIYNNRAAVEYYRQLLALLGADDPERGAILVALGEVEERVGAWEAALAHYEAAGARGLEAPVGEVGARSLLGQGRVRARQGAWADALTRLAEAQTAFTALGAAAAASAAGAERGRVCWLQGEYRAAREVLEASRAAAQAAGAPASEALALNHLGNLAWQQGELAQAQALHEASLALRRTLDDRAGIAASLNNLGNVAYSRGAWAVAEALYAKSLAVRQELGDRWAIERSLHNLGGVAQQQQQWVVAQERYGASLALARELGDRPGLAYTLNDLGEVAQRQGDAARAEELYRESLQVLRELGDRRGLATVLTNLGLVAGRQGARAAARGWLEESLGVGGEMGWGPHLLHALAVSAAVGDAGVATARLLGAVVGLGAAHGTVLDREVAATQEPAAAAARAVLGTAEYTAAFVAGQELVWEAAVAEALAVVRTAPSPREAAGPTATEP